MENKKSLDEFLNEATAITPEREEEMKKRAVQTANEFFKEFTIKKED